MTMWLVLVVVLGRVCLSVSVMFLAMLERDLLRARPESQPATYLDAPPFPVDLVIPWVDQRDPDWAAKYETICHELEEANPAIMWRHDPEDSGSEENRKIDRYYAVRLALQNLPRLGHVIVYTQRP